MKHLSVLILLTLLVMSLPAQETVDELDGHDWLSRTEQARYEYALGYSSGVFFSAVALYQMCGGILQDQNAMRAYEMLVTLTKISVNDVMNRIDLYYQNDQNLKTPLVTVPFIQTPIEGEVSYE